MIKAYVFDAYGTLFDVNSAVRRHTNYIGDSAERLSEIWRTKQLEYTWVRSLTGAYQDFEDITADALDFACAKCEISDASLKLKLLESYYQLDAYAEVLPTLQALKAKGFSLAILSNGTERMIKAALEHSELSSIFDAVFSVDQVRCFKTDPRAYCLVTLGLKLPAHEISFQSSNRWDIAGAAHFGFRTIWINRAKQPDEYMDLKPNLVLPDLRAMLEYE